MTTFSSAKEGTFESRYFFCIKGPPTITFVCRRKWFIAPCEWVPKKVFDWNVVPVFPYKHNFTIFRDVEIYFFHRIYRFWEVKGPRKVLVQFEILKEFNFWSSKIYVVQIIETLSRGHLKLFSSRLCDHNHNGCLLEDIVLYFHSLNI